MDKFEYTYSAKQNNELEEIRKKYLPPEEDKMALLRHLDSQVTKKATMISVSVGIIGAIIFGAGLSICLVSGIENYVIGIPLGIFGLIVTAVAQPLHYHTLKKERERIAPKVLSLIEEIKNEN